MKPTMEEPAPMPRRVSLTEQIRRQIADLFASGQELGVILEQVARPQRLDDLDASELCLGQHVLSWPVGAVEVQLPKGPRPNRD